MIPTEVIDRIREATDIVEVVSRHVLLKPSGRSFKGLCPFHQEKTPSFLVNPERQIFKCFGCGAGGNAYHFLMRSEGLTFIEAVRELAQRAKITLPDERGAADDGRDRERRRLLEAMDWAAARFRQALAGKAGEAARAYLERRGVSAETAERFGLGYAPAGWDNLLKAARRDHFSEDALVKAGLVQTKPDSASVYDRFRDRLMFPIRDAQGRAVAFGGRLLQPGEPKYLNSPETELFRKGELLYALDLARESARRAGRLILVEGYMDVIACHQAGIAETVATMGTALTPQQAKLLRRYAEKMILIYDADEAGVNASLRAFEVLKREGLGLQVVSLPGAKDPDEFIRGFGVDAFRLALDGALDVVSFVLKVALARHDVKTIEGKLAVVRQVVPFIALLKETALEDQVRRQAYARQLAESLQLDEQQIQKIVRQEASRPVRTGPEERTRPEEAAALAALVRPSEQTRAEEELLLSTLLRFPRLLGRFQERLNPGAFADAAYQEVARRLLDAVPAAADDEAAWLPRFLGAFSDPALADAVAGLAALSFSEQDPDEAVETARRSAEDCLRRLEGARLRERISEAQWRIREADRAGDRPALNTALQEELALKNQLKSLGEDWKRGKTEAS